MGAGGHDRTRRRPGARDLCARARVAQERGLARRAERYLRAAISREPAAAAAAWIDLGRLLRQRGELRDALASLRRAVRLAPRSSTAFVELGATLRALRQLREAESALRRAVAFAPRSARAQAALGDFVSAERGSRDEAQRRLRRALRLEPGSAPIRCALGLHLLRTGDDPAGRRELGAAARRGHPAARAELGLLLIGARRQRDRARGLRWLERAAAAGEARACFAVAGRLPSGDDGSDAPRAVALLVRAAHAGLAGCRWSA